VAYPDVAREKGVGSTIPLTQLSLVAFFFRASASAMITGGPPRLNPQRLVCHVVVRMLKMIYPVLMSALVISFLWYILGNHFGSVTFSITFV
jgi:hypothetical protein